MDSNILKDLEYETDSEAEAEAQEEELVDSNAVTEDENEESEDDDEYTPDKSEIEAENRAEQRDREQYQKSVTQTNDLDELKETTFNTCLSRLESLESETLNTPSTSPKTQQEADAAIKKHKVTIHIFCYTNLYFNVFLFCF